MRQSADLPRVTRPVVTVRHSKKEVCQTCCCLRFTVLFRLRDAWMGHDTGEVLQWMQNANGIACIRDGTPSSPNCLASQASPYDPRTSSRRWNAIPGWRRVPVFPRNAPGIPWLRGTWCRCFRRALGNRVAQGYETTSKPGRRFAWNDRRRLRWP